MEKKEHNAEIDKEKKIKNSSFIDAWKNAINGIIYATTTQANIKKQLVIAVAVVIISLFFNLSKASRSAWFSPYFLWYPFDIRFPSLSRTTHPTMGLGATLPNPFFASAKHIRIYFSSLDNID